MGTRLDLQTLLKTFTDNVYFQPPENDKIQYPCIIYKRDYAATRYADDAPYNYRLRYLITVIDRNADSDILAKVAAMPLSSFNRYYVIDRLHHDVFHVYF